jgi:hypothetical protein
MNPQEHGLRLRPVWRDGRLSQFFPGALQNESQTSPSKEETNMLKVLNNLRTEPDTVQVNTSPPIADASFDAPGNFSLKDNFYQAGLYVAVHAPEVRAKKGSPPPPPQPLVPQKINTKTTPVAILAKAYTPEVAPVEKKRKSDSIEPPAKQQKVASTPKLKQSVEVAPIASQLPPASPPSPKPPSPVPQPPVMASSAQPDLPPDDDDMSSENEAPQPPAPPRPAAAKKATPAPRQPAPSARAELLAGTGINESSYDSAEEPSDGEDLVGSSDDEDDDDDHSLSPARPLPPVHLSYEQRNAAEIASVRQQHSDQAPAKTGRKSNKLTFPKVQHIGATAATAPIPAGFVDPKPKKAKAVKEDKAILSKLANSERFFSRITPNNLKRKPQDLDSPDKGPNVEFVKLWAHAVDLALDVEFKRTANRTEAKKYGADYEARWLEVAKKTVYKDPPEDAREAKILTLHRLFWCYHHVAILTPDSPVSTSECWLIFSQPRSGQRIFIAPEVRVSFFWRYYEGIIYAYEGIHPWEFLKGRATFMVKRIRQTQSISLEKVEDRLKNWENNGVFRLMEWVNSTIMGGWNFFT